jgi:hypothetical protein
MLVRRAVGRPTEERTRLETDWTVVLKARGTAKEVPLS